MHFVPLASRFQLRTPGAALRAATEKPRKPLYLPNLPTLPGRVEFTSGGLVPANAQSMVVLALGRHGLLLLAGDRARAFTQEDLTAVFLLAQPLTQALEEAEK